MSLPPTLYPSLPFFSDYLPTPPPSHKHTHTHTHTHLAYYAFSFQDACLEWLHLSIHSSPLLPHLHLLLLTASRRPFKKQLVHVTLHLRPSPGFLLPLEQNLNSYVILPASLSDNIPHPSPGGCLSIFSSGPGRC